MEAKGETPKFSSPPKLPSRSKANGQTRFEKETAANGGKVDTTGDPIKLGPWVLGDTIGRGSSGRVRLARHEKTGKLAAIKIIPKNIMFSSRMSISNAGAKHDKLMLGIRREIVIMKLIDHPNIMSLYDVFEADNELYLLLEYIQGGELFDHLVNKGRLTPSEALNYFKQIINGVNYCHHFNICHRDLKPENLLLDEQKNIKIADFGMAAMEIANGMLETSCGSPHYASPEIVAGRAYHGAASDIWSCGVVLFALLVGRLPFDDPNMRVLLQKVRSGKFDMPAFIPGEARDLIRKMLVVDPDKRITMPDIMRHPFFTAPYTPRLSSPQPPSLNEIARTIASERDIDPNVLRNLAILWHGTSERKIVEALLSPEVAWEKAYYFLLEQYQTKQLEEYGDMENSFCFSNGRFDPPPELRLQAGREERESRRIPERETTTVSRPISVIGRRERDAYVGRGTIEHTSATRRAPPPPWQPPNSPDKHTRSSVPLQANTRPTPPSPAKRPRPVSVLNGPRPLSITKSPNAATHPNSVAGTTMTRPRVGAHQAAVIAAEDRMRMPPPPPPTSPRNSVISGDANTNRAIESANAEIVRARFGFGNLERAEAFAAISNSNQTSAIDGTNTRGLGFSVSNTSTTASPGHKTHNHNRTSVTAPVTPVVPQISTASAPTTPLTINAPVVGDPDLQKFFNEIAGALNTIGSNPTSPGPNVPSYLNMIQEVSQHSRHTSLEQANGSELVADFTNMDKNRTTELFKRKSGTGVGLLTRRPSGKENVKGAATPSKTHAIDGSSPYDPVLALNQVPYAPRKSRPAPLELSNAPRVSTFMASAPSPLPSPLLLGSEFKGHGWFSSLFNFKPATYVFFSRDNITATRRECANLLESFGVSVALEENGDGSGVLKCSVDKIQEANGATTTKAVKFRAQIQPQSHSANARAYPITPTPMGYGNMYLQSPQTGCVLTLIQERGAKSSLEAVAIRLRQEWRLDNLRSAEPSPMFESPLQLA